MPSERVQRRIDRLLDQADEALESNDWQKTIEICRAVLELDGDNDDASSYLAAAEKALGGGTPSQSTPGAIVSGTSEPSQAIPTSFANGRYEVTGFLGEGGKKKVYLVHDTTLDRDVAFGLIKADGLDDASRQRVTREAQAMARLGDNPNIMPIFDLGEENGQPYMVGPLMGGGDVEALIEDAGDGRLSLEDALRITGEICRGLEFAHSKSIIHRDLKPGNVWLTDDGTARIGDFGLAISLDRSRLTQEKMMVGTVSYMPPEQATGGEITPKADLYSLGAMLYEMTTGRPPFMGDNDIAIIGQHINTPPVAPQWHRPEIPATLDSLIMRLLSKNPAERPDSAADVLSALEVVDIREQPVAEALEGPAASASGSLDGMAGGVFVGRHQETDQLKAAFEEILSGHGKIIALVGEPGIGKTRIAQELATYATMRGAQILWGRCYEEKGAPPYCPWLQAIWECAKDLDAADLRTMLGAGAPEIADAIPYIRERLPDVPSAPTLQPEQARYRFFNSVGQYLQRASQEQPRVLILDDVHWADEPSLLLLAHIQHVISSTRLMVVMTYRDNELSLRHPLSRALAELQKQESFNRIWVRGLGESAIARFIEMAAGTAPPDSLSRAVYMQTEGNPLFMTEVVRMLVEDGDIGPDHVADRDSWTIRIPEGVRVVVGTRLSRLSAETDSLLSAAAVIGREFDIGLLADLAKSSLSLADEQSPEAAVGEAIESAIRARVLEEDRRAAGHYRFAHSLIQQTLLEELSAIRRMQLHADVAAAMERRAGPEGPDAIEITGHLGEAGSAADPARLAEYSLQAGEVLLDRYAYEEALETYQRALASKENQPVDAETASLLFGVGQAQAALLQTNEAQESLSRAFDFYLEVGDTAAAVQVASHPVGTGYAAVHELVVRALELVDPASPDAGELLSHHGFALGMSMGDFEGAQHAFDQSLSIARRERNPALEMWTLARSGRMDHYYLRTGECVAKNAQAAELNSGIGDPNLEIYARVCEVAGLVCEGGLDQARSSSETMIEMAENARSRAGLLTALWMKANVHYYGGNFELVRQAVDRGLELHPFHAGLLVSALLLEYTRGDLERGKEYRKQILEMSQRQPSGPVILLLPMALADSMAGAVERLDLLKEAARADLSSAASRPVETMEATVALGLAAVWEEDRAAAEEQYASLKPLRALVAADEFAFVSIDRVLGLLAGVMGQPDIAANQFEDALTFCRDAGYRPELAWTCSDYAETLLERDDPGDREKATELQDEAISIATELGMNPLLERVLAQREILKA